MHDLLHTMRVVTEQNVPGKFKCVARNLRFLANNSGCICLSALWLFRLWEQQNPQL
jgi:hypothetical protein